MKTRETAHGHWREILPALGIPKNFLNGKHQPCPIPGCGGKDRARFTDLNGEGKYICGQCGAGDGFELLKKFHGWSYARAANEIDKIIGNLPVPKPVVRRDRMTREDVAEVWKSGRAIQPGDPVDRYLRGRGIGDLAWGEKRATLRYVARMWHATSRKYHPCMLALFRSADSKSGTIHRTYLAEVEPRRMFVPFGVPKGGAIRLFDVPDLCMGVAEGIETALSASRIFKMTVWACANEGLLRAWQPPEGCKRVTIFGDNDSSLVGQSAAYDLGKRLLRENYHVTVEIPQTPDTDWNDALKDANRDDLPKLWGLSADSKRPGKSLPNA